MAEYNEKTVDTSLGDDRPPALNDGHIAPIVPALGASTIHEAAAANDAERNMSFRETFKLYRPAALWSIFFSTCLIMEGYDTLLIATLFAQGAFNKKYGDRSVSPTGVVSYELTAAWQSGLTNGCQVGEILGLFVTGIIADRFGNRAALMGALFLVLCFIFIVFFAQNLPMLLAGEILLGIPWGVFQTLTTTYASEVCPTNLRAYLTTYVNLCWVLGQFIGSGVMKGVEPMTSQWAYRIPFAVQWVWPVPLIIGIYLAPESPWWLVRHGKIDQARKSLRRLTSRHAVDTFNPDETISMMIHTDEMEKEETAGTSYWDLFKKSNFRRTEIVCMVWMIQTLCGSTFMGYSTYFFEAAGMAQPQAFSMSLGLYAVGAVGTIFSWFMMGWVGRRGLYFYGQCTMCTVLFIVGCMGFAGKDNKSAQWAIGAMLLIYTFTYDSTVGPVCYSLVSELTSTRLRIKGVVLARNMYNIIGIITNILTPRMLNSTAWNWGAHTGFFWAGSCALCAVWTFFRLPEPKGRTYGELDILFERGVSARKFHKTAVERLDARSDYKAGDDIDVAQVELVPRT